MAREAHDLLHRAGLTADRTVGPRRVIGSSRIAVAGQSIQDILLPFPIVFLIGTLATDMVFAMTDQPVWSRISLCLLCVGLALGIVCAVCSLLSYLSPERRRIVRFAWLQFPGIELAILLSLINLMLRVGDPAAAVSRTGLMLSTVVTTVLVVTAWTGGELSGRRRP